MFEFEPKIEKKKEKEEPKIVVEQTPEQKAEAKAGEIADFVAKRIFDNLTFLGDTVMRTVREMLPKVIGVGLGIEVSRENGSDVFKFVRTNGFKGVLERFIVAQANAAARKHLDEAMETVLERFRTDEKWDKSLRAEAESSYRSAYSHTMSELARGRIEGEIAKAKAEVMSAGVSRSALAAAIDRATERLSVPHAERLRALTQALEQVKR